MDTFVAVIFFSLAAAMGLLMVMAPGFVWFHILKMQWPQVYRLSAIRMTLYCVPLTLAVAAALTWQHQQLAFTELTQRCLLAGVACCLGQTPLLYWLERRRRQR